MLPHDHVLALIQNATSNQAVQKKTFNQEMNVKRQFVNKHLNKWAVIRQEPVNNGRETINHIESVHPTMDSIHFHEFTKNHTAYPVTDEMASHGSFTGHEKFI